jgi:hypothetical protein
VHGGREVSEAFEASAGRSVTTATDETPVKVVEAAKLISTIGQVAELRVLYFAEDAQRASKAAIHRAYPLDAENLAQVRKYELVREAIAELERFHGVTF